MMTPEILVSISAFFGWISFGWLYYTNKIEPALAYSCGALAIAIGILIHI